MSVCSSRCTIGLSISWKSSSTSTTGSSRPSRRSAICSARRASPGLADVPSSAPVPASARSTPSQKRGLQLSSRSSPSQATRRGSASAAHDDSSTVFPEPACAETSVTSPVVPRSTSSCSRGRSTRRAGGAGGRSFAAGNGTAGRRRAVGVRVVSTATLCIVPLGSWGWTAGFARLATSLPHLLELPRGHAGIPTACWHHGRVGVHLGST